MSSHDLRGTPEPDVPISEEQAVHMFMKGLELIKQSGLFDKCGAYAPNGWEADDSEIVAVYLSSDDGFIEHCQQYGTSKEGKD